MLFIFSVVHQCDDIRLLLEVKISLRGEKAMPSVTSHTHMSTITAFGSDDFSNVGILCTRQCLNRLFS